MIVIDIETSGLDQERCGLWQIGAVKLEKPEIQFLDESRIDDDDFIEPFALEITNKREEYLRDKTKKSQKELLKEFFKWLEENDDRLCAFQNPQFDMGFLFNKARKYGLDIAFHHRAIDLHSVAVIKYYQLYNKFLIRDKRSDMGLTNILRFCGMEDNRVSQNALEDAKLTAECLSRILFGKPLFDDFSEFYVPEHLIKNGVSENDELFIRNVEEEDDKI